MSINSSTFVGRLVRTPELMHTTSGKAVTSFTLAVDRRKKDAEADFIPCKAWESLGEIICRYCQKGRKIAVSGRMESRSYEDKSGNKRTVLECIVTDFSFADSKSEPQQSLSNHEATASAPEPVYGQQTDLRDYDANDDDDDLPF